MTPRARKNLEKAMVKVTQIQADEQAIFTTKGLSNDQRWRLLRAMDNADIIAKNEVSYIQLSYMCGCKKLVRDEKGQWVEEICARTMSSSVWGEKTFNYVEYEGQGEYKCWADYKKMYCLASAGDVLFKLTWMQLAKQYGNKRWDPQQNKHVIVPNYRFWEWKPFGCGGAYRPWKRHSPVAMVITNVEFRRGRAVGGYNDTSIFPGAGV